MGHRPLFYGWVVLAASAAVICVGMGTLFSLGVFLKPIEESLGWSRSAISMVAYWSVSFAIWPAASFSLTRFRRIFTGSPPRDGVVVRRTVP